MSYKALDEYKRESEAQWHEVARTLRFTRDTLTGNWNVPGILGRSFFSLLEAVKAFMQNNDDRIEALNNIVEDLVEGRQAELEAHHFNPKSNDEKLLELLREKKLIHAIKLRREQTNEPLIDAKHYVERLAVSHGIRHWTTGYDWK